MITIVLVYFFPLFTSQNPDGERLLKWILHHTTEDYIISGNCDYAVKLDSVDLLESSGVKILDARFCVYTEEQLFTEGIKRYIQIIPIDNNKFKVQWILFNGYPVVVEKEKVFRLK